MMVVHGSSVSWNTTLVLWIVVSVCVFLEVLSVAASASTAWTMTDKEEQQQQPFFEFHSGLEDYDQAYQLALDEVSENLQDDTFIAGSSWAQLWTRDTSYAVELGAGLLHPLSSRNSLRQSVETDLFSGRQVWLQDTCGHFGGWPYLSDAIVGVRGAWSIYLTTGDKEWLAWAYEVTHASLIRAERDVFDDATGLFLGCSSFMESNSGYPTRYRRNGELVGQTKALSTNLLHYAGYKLGSQMAMELNKPYEEIQPLIIKGEALRNSIRSTLWFSQRGYYAYVQDEYNQLMEQMEGLGESLALLDDFETDPIRIQSIFTSTYRSIRGIPCLWPQFKHTGQQQDISNYYHNGRIWPFVQGYWGLAAARHGQLDVFAEELANLVWLSEQGNTFAEFYELNGTFVEERVRQLWSDTACLCMIFHGLFGMKFLPAGIAFAPLVPASTFPGKITLHGVHYRSMILNIEVHGFGTHVVSCTLNGQPNPDAFVNANLTGTHTVSITLSDSPLGAKGETTTVTNSLDDATDTMNYLVAGPVGGDSSNQDPAHLFKCVFAVFGLLVMLVSLRGLCRQLVDHVQQHCFDNRNKAS